MLFVSCLNSDYFYYYKNLEQIEAETAELDAQIEQVKRPVPERHDSNANIANGEGEITQEQLGKNVRSVIEKKKNQHVPKMIQTSLAIKKIRNNLIAQVFVVFVFQVSLFALIQQ